MTEQITIPRATWDAMLEALDGIEHFSDAVDFNSDPLSRGLSQWIEAGREALTAANAVSVEPQEPAITWPQDAAEIREFIGSNFNSRTDGEPSDDDKYSLTAHDLLSAFGEWVEFVDMDALRERRIAHPQTTEPAWRPIETAPKDGRKIIVTYSNRNDLKRTVMACWVTAEQAAETDADDVGLEEGWYECIDNWNDYTEVVIHEGRPTHWMPLPAPPEAKQ